MVLLEISPIFAAGNCFFFRDTAIYCFNSWRWNVWRGITGNHIYYRQAIIIWGFCIRLAIHGMYCNIDWRNTATVCRNTWVVFFQDVSGDKAQTDLYHV